MSSRPARPAMRFGFAVLALSVLLLGNAARADAPIRVFAIRGLAGVVFSRGMNKLCDELASIPQVQCTVEDFYDESEIAKKAAAAVAAGQRLVLVGHSLGAHVALHVAGGVSVPVPLIVTVDPNWFAPPSIPQNAVVVINYYQDIDVLGRAMLHAPPGFQGELHQFLIRTPHILIDASPQIHTEIITRIKNMLAEPAGPPAVETTPLDPPMGIGTR